MENCLKLMEEVILLALDDRKGVFIGAASGTVLFTVGAAVMMDLTLSGRAEITGRKVTLKDPQSTSDDILDDALALLRKWNKPRNLRDAIGRTANGVRKLKKRLLERLVERGILRKERRSFLFLPYSVYPTADEYPETLVRQRVRGIVLEGHAAEARDEVLIALMDAGGLTNAVFDKSERKGAKARLKEIAKNSQAGKAVKELIDMMHAALATSIAASAAGYSH